MAEVHGQTGSGVSPRRVALPLTGWTAASLLVYPHPRIPAYRSSEEHILTRKWSKLLYTLLYVLPLYASENTRPSRTLSRDSPIVIRGRITSVIISTTLSSILTFLLLSALAEDGSSSPLQAMGYWPLGLWESIRSLFLVGLLFAGPLYEALVVHGLWKDWTTLRPLSDVWHEWTSWRNLVMVSSLAEASSTSCRTSSTRLLSRNGTLTGEPYRGP